MAYVYTSSNTPIYGNITLNATASPTYSIGTNGTSATDMWTNTAWTTAPVTITQKATIDLKGDDADIIINGESLKESIREIKEALRIPGALSQRDTELEQKWDELQAAADHYNQLLKEYREKQKVWDTLKT